MAETFQPGAVLVANGVKYYLSYCLASCIYTNWRLSVKILTDGVMSEERLFASALEAIRKNGSAHLA